MCVCVCFASSFVAYLELRVSFLQGAKKVIFTACHWGKLKKALLAQTSFQLAPKALWRAELISQLFFSLNSSKHITCPLGKLRTEFTSPIAKSTSPGQSISLQGVPLKAFWNEEVQNNLLYSASLSFISNEPQIEQKYTELNLSLV